MGRGGAWKVVHKAGIRLEVTFIMLHLRPPPRSCVLDLTQRAGVAASFCTSC